MPRGGARPGAGKPRGCQLWSTRDLHRRIEAAPGASRAERLAVVADDDTAPMAVRINAMRHLGDELFGRDRTAFSVPLAGRPAAAPDKRKTHGDTIRRLEAAPGDDVGARLAVVAEDPAAPLLTRMSALRSLAGLLYGRVRRELAAQHPDPVA